MAATEPFARRIVNSGRLSEPCSLAGKSLQSDGEDAGFAGGLAPGSPCVDAPIRAASGRDGWLLPLLGGAFCVLAFGTPADVPGGLRQVVVMSDAGIGDVAMDPAMVSEGLVYISDGDRLAAQRYGAVAGSAYLIRPDQHVAARFIRPTRERIAAAMDRALGKEAR